MDPERLAKCLVSHPKLRNIIIASVRIAKRHLPEGKIVVNVLESPDDETDLVEISVKEPDVGEDFEETKNVCELLIDVGGCVEILKEAERRWC